MKRKTLKIKIIEHLKSRGYVETKMSRTRKYTPMINLNKPGIFYFIGRNGAVRVGPSVSNSISYTHHFKNLFKKGETNE